MIKLTLLVTALFFGVVSCQGNLSVGQKANNFWFRWFGTTVGSDVREFALRELHLNVDSFLGKSVIVTGKLEEIGEHQTFAVIADSSSKILISLVKIGLSGDLISELESKTGKELSVLGTLEVGKRGLPIVVASAVFSGSNSGSSH